MNANSVVKSSDIVITFAQLMNGSLMTAENIKVFGYQTGLMTASLDYNSVSNTLTINPVNQFKNGEKISVTLTSGLKTISNESITPFVYSFRAKAIGGTGSFIKSSGIVSPLANSLLAGDLDSDGDVDLIINEKTYKNNGAAVFTYFSSLPEAGYSILADFDNDGDLDIIVRRDNIFDNYYFINDGFGNFSFLSTFQGGLGNFGDLNGDGFLDYCYYLSNSDIKMVFNISGNFIPDTSYYLLSQCNNNSANYIEETPLLEDLNNDGTLDIVGINGFREGNSITFYNLCKTYFTLSNVGEGEFTNQTIYSHNLGPAGPFILFVKDSKLFDYNNDGYIDLISPGVNIKNNGTGLFIENGFFSIFHNSLDDDFNADGFLDFITIFEASPLLQYFNNGDGTFTYIVHNSVNYAPLSVSADFDNDGDIDIAVKEYNTDEVAILLNGDSPLPVELSSFTSSVILNSVKLSWSTSLEQNNSGFEIQRSDNDAAGQEAWKKAGFVNGAGNSSSQNNYTYDDKNLSSGKYKYRLKQIDFNGGFEYINLSNEVVIGIPATTELMQNYPNPFNPVTNISYRLSENGFITLKVFDNSGREVKTLVNEFKEAGYYKSVFDGSGLASGIYFCKLAADNFNQTKKLSLVK